MQTVLTWNLRRVFRAAGVQGLWSWDVFDAVGRDVEVIVQSLRRWNLLGRWIRLVHPLPPWKIFQRRRPRVFEVCTRYVLHVWRMPAVPGHLPQLCGGLLLNVRLLRCSCSQRQQWTGLRHRYCHFDYVLAFLFFRSCMVRKGQGRALRADGRL